MYFPCIFLKYSIHKHYHDAFGRVIQLIRGCVNFLFAFLPVLACIIWNRSAPIINLKVDQRAFFNKML